MCIVDCGEDCMVLIDLQNFILLDGNLLVVDCLGCLSGVVFCEVYCQSEGLFGGFCVVFGSMNFDVCCVCDEVNVLLSILCGDGMCNGDEISQNCVVDCDVECKFLYYKMVNGECLLFCGVLINVSGWSDGICC